MSATWLGRLRALGLEEDTLVVFTSDNGPWFEGSSGPFRDRKGGSAWTAAFACRSSCANRATFSRGGDRRPGEQPRPACDLFGDRGVRAPDVELDGRDLSGVIFDGAASPHEEFILFDNAHVAAIRTARWKYVVRSYYRKYDVALDAFNYPLLFDLDQDPGENYSVARVYPEVALEMKGRLERARSKYEPLAEAFAPYTPPPGAENHPA